MPPPPQCKPDCPRPEPSDKYCAGCGRPLSRIRWYFSDRPAGNPAPLHITPGAEFYLIAHNEGTAPVRVEIQLDSGVSSVSIPGPLVRRVGGGAKVHFRVQHKADEPLRGRVVLLSDDDHRQPETWWRPFSTRREIRHFTEVKVLQEEWFIGAEGVLFPPGVREQYIRVWNASDRERAFWTEPVEGYRVYEAEWKVAVDRDELNIGPGNSRELAVQSKAVPDPKLRASQWQIDPSKTPLPLTHLPRRKTGGGPQVVVAIDFGTRNTSIRVRWRIPPVHAQVEPGSIVVVGDENDRERFPTEMILPLTGGKFRWGSAASEHLQNGRLLPGQEVAVENLKTLLREGRDEYVQYRADWDNISLTARYFRHLLDQVERYFGKVGRGLSRHTLDIQYVICRPVLDGKNGRESIRYEEALREALRQNHVPEGAVRFVEEPVAATIGIARRRQEELLRIHEGTMVAIVDSGGGTTDVAIGRKVTRAGKQMLEPIASYAVVMGQENPLLEALNHYGMAFDGQVGGNLIDCGIGFGLEKKPATLLESDEEDLPSGDKAQNDPLQLRRKMPVLEYLAMIRRYKEGLAMHTRLPLARLETSPDSAEPATGTPAPPPGPLADRTDLRGKYLAHDLVQEEVLEPGLGPVVGSLRQQIEGAGDETAETAPTPPHVRREPVQHTFFVGGTNMDPAVRQVFARLFAGDGEGEDPDAQSPERMKERLYAVVEGAVCFSDEQLVTSPFDLCVVAANGTELSLIRQGDAVLPEALSPTRYFPAVELEPNEIYSPSLIYREGTGSDPDGAPAGAGGTLPPAHADGIEGMVVAQGWYRNEGEQPVTATLCVTITQEQGVVAELQVDGKTRVPLWRFALVEKRR